jgi:hypothetical protein
VLSQIVIFAPFFPPCGKKPKHPSSIMSTRDAVERFDSVCDMLATDNVATRQMVPEVLALVALYSLDIAVKHTIESLLATAGTIGHTRLVKTGMLSLDPIMQQQVKWAVAKASLRHEHLSLAQWLHDSFHLSAADVRSNENSVLQLACFRGCLGVVQYLHTTFQLTIEDARANNNNALRWACNNGNLAVVQYLHTGFQLTSEDTRACNNVALLWACSNGHLGVVQYLHTAFELTREDARACNNYALQWACRNGHLTVVQYLHTAFQLTREDARAYNNYMLQCARDNGHLDVVRYLHTAF